MKNPVRLIGSGSMWRHMEPPPEAKEDRSEPCHVLPPITAADVPEVWNYKDIIVCEVCKGAWFVNIDRYDPELSRDEQAFWEPITFWRHPWMRFDAEEILATIEGIHLGEGAQGDTRLD